MHSDLEPEFAIVRPRVIAGHTAATALLEEEVGALLADPRRAHVVLVGPEGSGKRTALAHLAAVFADETELEIAATDKPPSGRARVVIAAATRRPADAQGSTWTLAPWSDDDCFDYLLAEHASAANTAISAFREAAPLHDLRRWPGLCRAVLDHLARVAAAAPEHDHSGHDALCALAFVLAHRLGHRRAAARAHALATFAPPHVRPAKGPSPLGSTQEPWLLQSLAVRALLAAEELLRCAAEDDSAPFAPRAWPTSLAQTIAHLLHADPTVMHRLLALAARTRKRPALLLSALCAAIHDFRPPMQRLRDVAGARLPGIDLRGLSLPSLRLDEALLRGATVAEADLRGASAVRIQAEGLRAERVLAENGDFTEADLRGADLAESKLARAVFARADLSGADLRGADLRGADLRNALLRQCEFVGAALDGCDLSGTDLTGCSLQGSTLTAARCQGARLVGLDLTDVVAADADFTDADLSAARLAGADLRRAIFRAAVLTASDLEGADMRGADLRATPLDGVDLYRVDLRGARLDPRQREHATRCRAILGDDDS